MTRPWAVCEGECRVEELGSRTTAMYFPPIYDKNGVNINPDRNITSGSMRCNTCGKKWHYSSCAGVTEYQEVQPTNKT